MSRLAPKSRMVTFRVSEEEYSALKELCRTISARSVSELARAAVRGLTLDGRLDPDGLNEVPADLQSPWGPLHRLEKIAQSGLPVLIYGETGAGKTSLAEQLHALSSRASTSMVRLDCSVLEAPAVVPGFARAEDTTLLLKDVGLASHAVQAAMLEPLQRHASTPAAGRILATTRLHLDAETRGNRFRQDLYYEFNVLKITLRPLRDRKDDILPLARQFLRKHTGGNPYLSPALSAALIRYPWPGNLRELDNVMRAYAVTHDPAIVLDRLAIESETVPERHV